MAPNLPLMAAYLMKSSGPDCDILNTFLTWMEHKS